MREFSNADSVTNEPLDLNFHAPLSRRALLKSLACAGAAALISSPAAAQVGIPHLAATPAARARILAYLASLARPGNAYGWEEQDESNLTATYAVVGALRALGQTPPNAKAVAEFVRTHYPLPPRVEDPIRIFEFQQIQTLRWLGDPADADFKEKVKDWVKPEVYLPQYEKHKYPVFQYQMAQLVCRAMAGLPASDITPEFVHYIDERRRPNGSFNNTPVPDGDGHVMNTFWGLHGLRLLGRITEKSTETIAWLQSCQLPGGGFTYAPKPAFGGNDDVAYTRAAVLALEALNAKPANRESCLAYLWSLWNEDGGFGDRPGWLSNPMATYYALEALAALGALEDKKIAAVNPTPRPHAKPAPLPAGLRVCTIQIEAHGQGSPAEAVDLAGALKIDLWGAKNPPEGWVARAQALADAQKVPVKFFIANEEYGTFMNLPGFGTYSHMSDIFAPAGAPIGPSLAKDGVVTWEEFRKRRIAPLEAAGGRIFWQYGENEEMVRALLDDSLTRGGFSAISTFHFGNPDFTYSEPFLYRYRGQLPYIGLQDAHGAEPWWFSDQTTGFRTLFLATEPTWEGWMNALKRNWVVPVRHDVNSGGRLRLHSGAPEVAEFVRQREAEWRWWDNPARVRPAVSLVVVKPGDEFEAARPERGVALRVRCQWVNTTQGLPKTPVTELVSLTVDGQKVTPKEVKKGRAPKLSDVYHLHTIESPTPGKHTATVTVREIEGGKQTSRTVEFTV